MHHPHRRATPLVAIIALLAAAPAIAKASGSPAAPPARPAPEAPPDDNAFGDADRMRGRVSAGLAFGVGVLPVPGLGAGLGLGFQWRRFSMAVEGRALFTPNFTIAPEHAAFAALPMGILSLCYQAVSLPRPLYTLDFCPLVGAGRLFINPADNEDQPHYFEVSAHPFALMAGLRFPVSWQFMPAKAPFFYLRAYLEGDIGLLRNHVSFNNVSVWGDLPPFGLTIGLEFSAVLNQPRLWNKPAPESAAAEEARTERRYW